MNCILLIAAQIVSAVWVPSSPAQVYRDRHPDTLPFFYFPYLLYHIGWHISIEFAIFSNKGDIFMPTEAMKRAIKKYNQEKVDKVIIRTPKGMREKIKEHVLTTGESINGFVIRAINEAMERDPKQN